MSKVRRRPANSLFLAQWLVPNVGDPDAHRAELSCARWAVVISGSKTHRACVVHRLASRMLTSVDVRVSIRRCVVVCWFQTLSLFSYLAHTPRTPLFSVAWSNW